MDLGADTFKPPGTDQDELQSTWRGRTSGEEGYPIRDRDTDRG